jgi:DNA-binding transcriptional ArsR family regulator
VQREFPISQPAVAQHLRVLRESGFATVRSAGTQRIYVVDALPLEEVDSWLMRFRQLWEERLDELGEEVTRGRAEQAASDAPDG